MMLHAVWCGEEAGARNRVFFRVKWLQPAMKATSSVRRLRLGSFGSFYVFCTNVCSCVRSSMRFLTLWCQIALEWLHDVAWALCWGGSRSTKPCVFPCKVAAAGDEATSSVRRLRLSQPGSLKDQDPKSKISKLILHRGLKAFVDIRLILFFEGSGSAN